LGLPADTVDQALAEELGAAIHPKVLDHVVRPRNAGLLEDPDGEATLTRECGDGLCIQLRVQGDRIREIGFMTNGCGAMLACGSAVTELARGRTLRQAMALDGAAVMEVLEGLPLQESHCATLSAGALKAAVRNVLMNRQEAWKRPYRRRNPGGCWKRGT